MEVIVLCGGLGTRLRSVIHEIPKTLAPIASGGSVLPEASKKADASGRTDASGEGEVPFLQYLLAWLGRYGVTHVVFSVGYLREQVMAFVRAREWPFSYDFAVEETPLGTGGGIRLALSLCREQQVFVVNGDTFFPVDLDRMPFRMPVTLALKPMKDFSRYGTVSVMPGPTGHLTVTAFHEKQPCAEGLINGGVYAIDRSRLDLSSLPERFSFEKEVLEPGAAIGEIGGWVSDAYFIDIGIPEDYALAQWALPAYFAVQKASEAVLQAQASTLFLDRDGVLNRHLPGDYVKSRAQWQWMPGVLQELPRWAAKYRHIILVTNQRGVGKGLMTDEDLSAIHAQMMADVLEAGGRIDLILCCTAVSDQDPRRKPHPGMFYEACGLFPDIVPEQSVMLGDADSDAAFAKNCGIGFIRL